MHLFYVFDVTHLNSQVRIFVLMPIISIDNYGSYALHLTNTYSRDIASLGSLIMIMSLAFDPFLQILITYSTGPSSSTILEVSIARANN